MSQAAATHQLAPRIEAPAQVGQALPAEPLVVACWFGLLTGLGEVAILTAAKFVLHRYLHPDWRLVWMTTPTDLVLFALVGSGLWVAARRWPRLISLRVVVLLLTFLSAYGILLRFKGLHIYAKWLLAAGVAVQTARMATMHQQRFRTLVRRSWPWMAGAAVLLALGINGNQMLRDRRALAALPEAPTDAPNVLLIVMDTVRAHDMSVYGYDRPTTPHLQQFAATGVQFDNAFPTASWTLPSHAGMFTGRFVHQLAADWTVPLSTKYPTLAEVLSRAGYLTGGFVGNSYYCSRESGLSRGFVHYEDFLDSPGQFLDTSSLGRHFGYKRSLRRLLGDYHVLGRKSGGEVTDEFLRWLPQEPKRPFFAFVNYIDAHMPYLPPPPFSKRFGVHRRRPEFHPTLQQQFNPRWHSSPRAIKAEHNAYDGAIAYIDSEIGRILDALARRRLRRNTLIIITADHGEELREHGIYGHGNDLYLTVLHVPLLVSFPGHVPTGVHVRQLVSLHDLPTTVLDLVHIDDHGRLPGTSLARYWSADPPPAARILSEVNYAPNLPAFFPVSRGDMKSLIGSHYHYIRNGDGREELYDWRADPWEMHDLAATPEGRQAIFGFRATLEARLADKRS